MSVCLRTGSIVLYLPLTKFTVLVLCVHTTSMHLARQSYIVALPLIRSSMLVFRCSVKCCLTASSFDLTLPSLIHSLYPAPRRQAPTMACQKPRLGCVKHYSHHDKFSQITSQSLY
ncbi:hypothetical protein C8R48DRAFT_301568 [Suillus tomentosus]|nr:hypothetical protein C8R48DRAFT_301568 [Suillus tomentosus]